MGKTAARQSKRKVRRLAKVNRRIVRLCNELESLQQVQDVLERDIAKAPPGPAGGPGKARNGG